VPGRCEALSSNSSAGKKKAGCLWLTPIILATQEAESNKIVFQSQPGQIVCETYLEKKKHIKKRAGGVAQDVAPEFKPQY
jgi:hypothetical protein